MIKVIIRLVAVVIAITLGVVAALAGLYLGLAYSNQKEIKTTCNKSLNLNDAFWYNLKAGGCPTVTIKKG